MRTHTDTAPACNAAAGCVAGQPPTMQDGKVLRSYEMTDVSDGAPFAYT